ncbi:MAG: hypothetical protein NVS4B11_21070 [Ktedonobacteraceae bacterium]
MATNTNNSNIQAIRQSVSVSYNELQQLIEDRLMQLETVKFYEIPQQDEWTLMESLAHIIEFMPYWADEIAKLVAHPGQNFGRTKEDEARIHAIEEHKQDTLDEARGALTRSFMYLDKVLSTLKDSDLELKGQHPKFGEQTLGWFIKDFVTGHLTNHIKQMTLCLESVEKA